MVKRTKKIGRGIENLKKQIKGHFSKIEEDIKENRIERGLYHIKEIDKSLLKALELKLGILGIKDRSVEVYKERLRRIKEDLKSK
ncbi:MAG: hypothetical protein AABW56_05585 [Nanoarchaeota archaeon]